MSYYITFCDLDSLETDPADSEHCGKVHLEQLHETLDEAGLLYKGNWNLWISNNKLTLSEILQSYRWCGGLYLQCGRQWEHEFQLGYYKNQ